MGGYYLTGTGNSVDSLTNNLANYGNPVTTPTGIDYGSGMDFPNSSYFNSSNMGLLTDSTSVGMGNTGFLDKLGNSIANWSGWDSPTQQKLADGTTTGGWMTSGLSAVQGLGNLYLGMQQYGLAKDALANSKNQFQLNYDAQKKTTNASLEDRQRARVASNPNAYQSVGAYMSQNGIA